jgi:hypothetical protein
LVRCIWDQNHVEEAHLDAELAAHSGSGHAEKVAQRALLALQKAEQTRKCFPVNIPTETGIPVVNSPDIEGMDRRMQIKRARKSIYEKN